MINPWESLNVCQDNDCMSCFLPGKATHSELIFCGTTEDQCDARAKTLVDLIMGRIFASGNLIANVT